VVSLWCFWLNTCSFGKLETGMLSVCIAEWQIFLFCTSTSTDSTRVTTLTTSISASAPKLYSGCTDYEYEYQVLHLCWYSIFKCVSCVICFLVVSYTYWKPVILSTFHSGLWCCRIVIGINKTGAFIWLYEYCL